MHASFPIDLYPPMYIDAYPQRETRMLADTPASIYVYMCVYTYMNIGGCSCDTPPQTMFS